MGSDQHFCLRWNNFHSNIAASFEHLRDHEEFVDVTLACEGRSLKAHKIVLSACSPYFKNLLKQNPCQHPIIILRDVAFPDLSALLSFVYQGEVYVSQDRLPAFLRTAEMLHIKGLTEQNQHRTPGAGVQTAPVSIGPPTSTTILQTAHDQGIISNKVSIMGSGVTPSSPRCQTPPSPSSHLQHPHLHISPPPKKRRSATTITALPSGSPTTTVTTTPTSSTSPRMEVFPSGQDGLEPHLEGSTLAAALTKPLFLTGIRSSSAELVVTPSRLVGSHSPSGASPIASSQDVPKVKQEVEDLKVIKEEDDLQSDQAVNLVTEGSILRQRIQGFRGSPDAPLPSLNTGNGRPPPLSLLSTPISHDDSSLDEGFAGGLDLMGEGGGDAGMELEKDSLTGAPMVIRSPLGGLLPRDAQGLFGGAGTSGSLVHHDSSQGTAPVMKFSRPRYAGPRDCPHCGIRYSTIAALKYHVGLVHSVSDQVPCYYCPKWFDIRTDLKKHLELAHNEHS